MSEQKAQRSREPHSFRIAPRRLREFAGVANIAAGEGTTNAPVRLSWPLALNPPHRRPARVTTVTPTTPVPGPFAALSPAGRPAWFVASMRITCLLSGEETGGAYAMFEIITPPRDPGPPPHTHTLEDEAFYVLEGEHIVIIDGEQHRGGPGSWFFGPRGKPHAFRNDSDAPTRVLLIASPAGVERFFEACGTPATQPGLRTTPPSDEEIQKILEEIPKFGMTAHLTPPISDT